MKRSGLLLVVFALATFAFTLSDAAEVTAKDTHESSDIAQDKPEGEPEDIWLFSYYRNSRRRYYFDDYDEWGADAFNGRWIAAVIVIIFVVCACGVFCLAHFFCFGPYMCGGPFYGPRMGCMPCCCTAAVCCGPCGPCGYYYGPCCC